MATGRIGTTPVLTTRWSKAPAAGTTSLSGLDDNSVSLVYSVGYEAVYQNGVLLSRGNDYTATNGTTITLTTATVAGDIIEVFANQTIPLTDTYSQTVSDGRFIKNTLTTTTGDIIYASAANTPARLGIGSTNQVLTVSGGVPTWATPAGGGLTWTLLNTGGTALTGAATITVSGISNKEYIMILLDSAGSVNAGAVIAFRINTDTGNNYYSFGPQINAGSTYSTNVVSAYDDNPGSYFRFAVMSSSATSGVKGGAFITGGKSTGIKSIQSAAAATAATGSAHSANMLTGYYNASAAITSISIFSDNGNFDTGTVWVYGA